MKSLSVFMFCFVSLSVLAAEPDTLWTRTYGGAEYDGINCVQQISDGNFVAVGYTGSYGVPGRDHIYFMKIDGSGDTLWTRVIGGNGSEVAYSVQETSDGGFIIGAATSSFGAGGTDFYLIKANSNGDTIWTKTYGGSDQDVLRCVQQTSDGGYILTGTTKSYGIGLEDIWLIKTDSQGQTTWTKTYGGSSNDEASAVQQTVDGGYIVAGITSSFGADPDNGYLVRTNSTGDTLWTRTYGGDLDEDFRTVQQTTDGGFIAAGACQYLVKTSSTGDTLWTRYYQPSGVIYSIQQLPDGGYIMAGSCHPPNQPSYNIVRTDSIGAILWSRTYGGTENDIAHSIQQTTDGGYIVAGETFSFGAGENDCYVVRLSPDPRLRILDPNGAEVWQVFQDHLISWWGFGFDSVQIELNRNYPDGVWEMLVPITVNDGSELVYIDAPPSEHCRIRITAKEDTSVDVSDNDFSIVSSQGYLALIRTDQSSIPVESWDAGTTECPESFTENFKLKNFGSEVIVVFQPLEPLSDEFSRETNCGLFFALTSNQVSSCTLAVIFSPAADGTYRDTLLIQTDAVNGVNGFVQIPLSGTQISTPSAPELVVTIEGEDSRISWNPISESVGGCPITVQRYLLFFSEEPDGPYWYLGGTVDTTYVHPWAVSYAVEMCYKALATTTVPVFLVDMPENKVFSLDDVVARLKE